ncbi:hypothetical protein G7046_g2481 [Stylonectria norvegica]|nr:hypothetical protein G7046_g2481 [Stylonectria norvegica]
MPDTEVQAFDWRSKCPLGVCKDESKTYDLLTVKQSAQRGCLMCKLSISAAEHMRPGWTDRAVSLKQIGLPGGGITFWSTDEEDEVGREITLVTNGEVRGRFHFVVCLRGDLYPQSYENSGVYPFNKFSLNISRDSSSAEALSRARKWLEFCEENDDICQGSSSNYLPKRLLRVLPMGDSTHITLTEIKTKEKYACLSYCWGSNLEGVLTTTKSNIPRHYGGIPVQHLPKTIQDAVTVCLGVKVPYLWVDSLCILQDDQQDWQHESSQMVNIYGRSHLTIYASGPTSRTAGFLGRQEYGRSKWQARPRLRIPTEFKQGEAYIMLRSGVPKKSQLIATTRIKTNLVNRPDTSKAVAESSLDERGWCLQETILPNRRLYFDGNEMSWECSCRRMCECGHTTFMPVDPYASYYLEEKFPFLTVKQIIGLAKHQDTRMYHDKVFFRDWRALVEDYSGRRLTKSTDKLVAISGLAAMILKAQGAEVKRNQTLNTPAYSKVALYSLCRARPARATPYVAPSWSWASNDAAINYDSWLPHYQWKYTPHLLTRITLDDVKCNLVTAENPTGSISSGYAVVTGPLIPVQLRRLDAQLANDWEARGEIVCAQDSDDSDEAQAPDQIPQEELVDKCVALVRNRNLSTYQVYLDIDTGCKQNHQHEESRCWISGHCVNGSGCCTWILEEELYCLELFAWLDMDGLFRPNAEDMHYHGIPPDVWFLLLRKNSDGTFERVGVGECRASEIGVREAEEWPRSETGLGGFENPLFAEAKKTTIKIV